MTEWQYRQFRAEDGQYGPWHAVGSILSTPTTVGHMEFRERPEKCEEHITLAYSDLLPNRKINCIRDRGHEGLCSGRDVYGHTLIWEWPE